MRENLAGNDPTQVLLEQVHYLTKMLLPPHEEFKLQLGMFTTVTHNGSSQTWYDLSFLNSNLLKTSGEVEASLPECLSELLDKLKKRVDLLVRAEMAIQTTSIKALCSLKAFEFELLVTHRPTELKMFVKKFGNAMDVSTELEKYKKELQMTVSQISSGQCKMGEASSKLIFRVFFFESIQKMMLQPVDG